MSVHFPVPFSEGEWGSSLPSTTSVWDRVGPQPLCSPSHGAACNGRREPPFTPACYLGRKIDPGDFLGISVDQLRRQGERGEDRITPYPSPPPSPNIPAPLAWPGRVTSLSGGPGTAGRRVWEPEIWASRGSPRRISPIPSSSWAVEGGNTLYHRVGARPDARGPHRADNGGPQPRTAPQHRIGLRTDNIGQTDPSRTCTAILHDQA